MDLFARQQEHVAVTQAVLRFKAKTSVRMPGHVEMSDAVTFPNADANFILSIGLLMHGDHHVIPEISQSRLCMCGLTVPALVAAARLDICQLDQIFRRHEMQLCLVIGFGDRAKITQPWSTCKAAVSTNEAPHNSVEQPQMFTGMKKHVEKAFVARLGALRGTEQRLVEQILIRLLTS